ncbi:TPA: hypothetical protein ACNTTQ_004602 [Escherichia coli]
MELITDNFYEWVVVSLAILNFIVILKYNDKITLLLTTMISLLLDEPVYSNIYEKDPSSLTLEFFQSVLERYGIENVSLLPGHESGLYEKLHDDRRNNN